MLVSDFDYVLPEELIAQHPPAERGASRMLRLDRHKGIFRDAVFTDLPNLLQPGDLLVMNDSRVIPARLLGRRAGLRTQAGSPAPEGLIEALLTERCDGTGDDANGALIWKALVKPAKKISVGETLLFTAPPNSAHNETTLRAEVIAAGEYGERTLRFAPVANFYEALERIGHMPLPPYIHRSKTEPNSDEDRERYQTVISSAETRGSAAAPTAGLHFTPEILARLKQRGIELATITLHVGLGTFQPVRVECVEDIRLHAEPYTLSEATASALNRAQSERRRIIAVGTTVTRTLEHVAREAERTGSAIHAHSGSTSLFLSPGAEFKLVGGLLTNFHLPQSTLLMLVSAFAGRENALTAYRHAVAERYRFFSYGDCMLIL